MDRITDAFVWPFRDPEWPAKIGIIGLILLIPIVGSINGLGWMLAGLDGLPAGEERLPPANLRYLGLGFRLIAVHFVASLGLMICVIGVLFTNAYGLAMQTWIVRSFEMGPPQAA